MSEYYSDGNYIKENGEHRTVGLATHDRGAEIIVKALNFYFGDAYTRNRAVEMMHSNTASALTKIANFLEKHEYTGEMAVAYLKELAEEMEAQAKVVALRDELRFSKPNE